jgi:hypothetical protein
MLLTIISGDKKYVKLKLWWVPTNSVIPTYGKVKVNSMCVTEVPCLGISSKFLFTCSVTHLFIHSFVALLLSKIATTPLSCIREVSVWNIGQDIVCSEASIVSSVPPSKFLGFAIN